VFLLDLLIVKRKLIPNVGYSIPEPLCFHLYCTNLNCMVQKLLLNCAQAGDHRTIQVIVEKFLEDWKVEMEQHGFSFDPSGRVNRFPDSMNEFQQKLMKEYFMLQCLDESLDLKHLSVGYPGCSNPWVNILTTSQENEVYLQGLTSILTKLFYRVDQPVQNISNISYLGNKRLAKKK
jgi:hypothetical protein